MYRRALKNLSRGKFAAPDLFLPKPLDLLQSGTLSPDDAMRAIRNYLDDAPASALNSAFYCDSADFTDERSSP